MKYNPLPEAVVLEIRSGIESIFKVYLTCSPKEKKTKDLNVCPLTAGYTDFRHGIGTNVKHGLLNIVILIL